ncbi:MAG: hypothetical protein ACKN9E_04825 [Microcystaceae cyanobacterium]
MVSVGKKLAAIAPAILGAILFSLSVWVIWGEIQRYGWQNVLDSLQQIPKTHLIGGFVIMVINYIVITGYDIAAIFYVKESLSPWQSGFVGFLSYSISNSVGFSVLSGSAIRYRFYRQWGISNLNIARIIYFCNISFWLGMAGVCGVTFLLDPLPLPSILRLPFVSVRPLGVICLTFTLGYLILGILSKQMVQLGRWRLPHVPIGFSLFQIGITGLDWGLSTAIIYLLLPHTEQLDYGNLFSIFLLAQIAGLLSNIPGGLGVFETIILFGLTPIFSSVTILGALLGYRVIYYWIPLSVSALAIGIYEVYRHLQPKNPS